MPFQKPGQKMLPGTSCIYVMNATPAQTTTIITYDQRQWRIQTLILFCLGAGPSLACRTGVIFCIFQANSSESKESATHDSCAGKRSMKNFYFSRFPLAHDSRSPGFRLCSSKICKNITPVLQAMHLQVSPDKMMYCIKSTNRIKLINLECLSVSFFSCMSLLNTYWVNTMLCFVSYCIRRPIKSQNVCKYHTSPSMFPRIFLLQLDYEPEFSTSR